MLQRFGVEQREVLCRLSEPRQNKKDALCMDLKPEVGKGSIHLAGGAGWSELLTSEWVRRRGPRGMLGAAWHGVLELEKGAGGAGCTGGKAGRVLGPSGLRRAPCGEGGCSGNRRAAEHTGEGSAKMGARFPTVRQGTANTEKEKTRMDTAVLTGTRVISLNPRFSR